LLLGPGQQEQLKIPNISQEVEAQVTSPKNNRVLIITAHPDDSEFGAAGTTAKWVSQGKEVYYLICTNGDKGSNDPEMTSERLAQIREQEQREAAAILGVKEVAFLRHPDGSLEDTSEFRGEVVRYIRKFRPYSVITHDIYRRYLWHRDHRITGRVVMDAVFPYARDRLSYPEHEAEGLKPHKVREVYFWASEEPNTFIDISDTFDKKVAALRCHRSQISDAFENGLEERLRQRAMEAGKEKGMLMAESFYKYEINR
jgi:LmbE family N-acetylglucosaminyl deacetylase